MFCIVVVFYLVRLLFQKGSFEKMNLHIKTFFWCNWFVQGKRKRNKHRGILTLWIKIHEYWHCGSKYMTECMNMCYFRMQSFYCVVFFPSQAFFLIAILAINIFKHGNKIDWNLSCCHLMWDWWSLQPVLCWPRPFTWLWTDVSHLALDRCLKLPATLMP